jgi:PAS domain S-box-containing protein
MNKEYRILILEDVATDAELIERELRKADITFTLKRVESRDAFARELAAFAPDLILSDYTLPSFDGLSALALAQAGHPDVPFIFVSGTIGEEKAIETFKSGATDYVLKDRIGRLAPAVERALREAQERSDRQRAEAALARLQEQTSQLVGELNVDRLSQSILQAACEIVPADLAVLPRLNGHYAGRFHLASGQRAAQILGRRQFMNGSHPALIRGSAPVPAAEPKNGSHAPRQMIEAIDELAEIAVPLVKGDHALGVLKLQRLDGPFSDAEHRLLSIFGSYAAGLIESAQLYDQMRQAEARYRDLYDNAPDGYTVVDADSVIQEMNATLLNWLGYTRDEVIGKKSYEDLLTPEGWHKCTRFLPRCQPDGHLDNVELVRSDGRLLPVRLHVVVTWDANRQYQGFRATARDISKEKELEAQLLQAQKLESLGTLVGGIAHDFNNILSGILGFTSLVMEDVKPGNEVHDGLNRIQTLCERAADMVKQLLAFSRKDQTQKSSLWLHPYLKEIVKLLERMIPETIEINLRLNSESVAVEADPAQLQQVVMNLAVNARDAMPEGGWLDIETALVQVDEEFCRSHPDLQPGTYVRLSVSDTGVGIAPEIQPRIFDPFFTTKELGKGTGLGLAVVHGIVKNHAGAIDVKSQVGEGTSVQVYLPLAKKEVKAESKPVEMLRGGETILVVDDEPIVLEVGKMALERLGYKVLTARDGMEALQVYQAHQDEIALVIMDVVMPKMGGRETFRKLRHIDPAAKVLLATGYDASQVKAEDLEEEGIHGLMRKPFRIADLAQTVRSALEYQPVCPQLGAPVNGHCLN